MKNPRFSVDLTMKFQYPVVWNGFAKSNGGNMNIKGSKLIFTMLALAGLSVFTLGIFAQSGTAIKKIQKVNLDLKFGFKFVCHAGPGKNIAMTGSNYEDALNKARAKALAEGCKMPTNLHYVFGWEFCSKEGNLYKVEGKFWAVDENGLRGRIDQVIAGKGRNPACGGSGGGGIGKFEKEVSSKAALTNLEDAYTWKDTDR